MPDVKQNDDATWEQKQFEAQSAPAGQTTASSSSESIIQNKNQAAMAAQLQAAQTAAYQDQIMQMNAAQLQEAAEIEDMERAQKQARAKKSNDWKVPYMMLFFSGAVVDALSFMQYLPAGFLITVPMNFMYSTYRWITLERLNAGSESSTQKWFRRGRTILGGVGGSVMGGTFANTTMMAWEWTTKQYGSNLSPGSILTAKASSSIRHFGKNNTPRFRN
jgi:hypothetical protein